MPQYDGASIYVYIYMYIFTHKKLFKWQPGYLINPHGPITEDDDAPSARFRARFRRGARMDILRGEVWPGDGASGKTIRIIFFLCTPESFCTSEYFT